MIIKRPSIFIYVNNPDAVFLRDVCAGIEEEGVFYEIKEMETALPDELEWNAANDSMLGSGVGISGKGRNTESYQNPTPMQCRKLGANSARAVKKLAFK